MATFGSHDAWADYHRAEGFRVGILECQACGAAIHLALHPAADDTQLKCSTCNQQRSIFTETIPGQSS